MRSFSGFRPAEGGRQITVCAKAAAYACALPADEQFWSCEPSISVRHDQTHDITTRSHRIALWPSPVCAPWWRQTKIHADLIAAVRYPQTGLLPSRTKRAFAVNDQMALRLIAAVMGWPEADDGTATREYAWLRFMSSAKYDGYSDFRAGVRFLESLSTWLKQFAAVDRQAAYDFIKTRLVYVSPPELLCLIESFVPEIVTPYLRKVVAQERGVDPYEIWSTPEGNDTFNRRLRKTLFVGMSDGSRIDMLRRANPRRISQEQVVPMLNIDDEKWKDLNKNLSEDRPGEKFDSVYLIDDFTASGTTFIRKGKGIWKGKLQKFNELVRMARDTLKDQFPLTEGYDLHIHHYISSHRAHDTLQERMQEAEAAWDQRTFGHWRVTEGLRLPQNLELTEPNDHFILDLCDRYYDHGLFERLRKHCEEARQTDMKRGYANCALPIVLDHNTPNNSISLLWAETDGVDQAHAMRPLFHRRDRHG